MKTCIVAVLITAAGLVQASDSGRLEALTITVTAGHPDHDLPLAITTVDVQDHPAPNEQSLRHWLDAAAGLFALNQDNAAQGLRVSIRGFGSRAAFGVRGIRVFLDGVPLTLPDGQTELDALDLALLDSVQIIRGPSATLFGNAAGGAILLRQRQPASRPQARLSVYAGSHGHHRLRLEGTGYGLLGSYLTTSHGGYRAHADSESDLISMSLTRRLGKGQLMASISDLDISANDPGGLTAEQVAQNRRAARPQNVQFNAGERIRQQRLVLGWAGQIGDWSLQSRAYMGGRDFNNRLPFLSGGQVAFDRRFGGLGSSLSRRFGAHRISAGMDAQSQRDDRQRYNNNDGQRAALSLDQHERASSAGLYLRDTIALGNAWETSLGLRYDRLRLSAADRFLADGNDSGSHAIGDWSADASLAHWRGTAMFYVRLASSFESPTINELANPGGGGFNPALTSTDAVNLEFGTKGQWRTITYTTALYRIRVNDELLPFELASQPGRRFFRNAGQTQRRGLEITATAPLSATWQLTASLNYASSRFKGAALAGNRLPGIPDQTAWLSLGYAKDRFDAALIGNYVGRLFADDANTAAVAGYALLNLQAAWQLGEHVALRAGIDNLLGKDYHDNIRINAFGGRYFEPAAGRGYRASIGLSF